MIIVAPDDTNRCGNACNLAEVVLHPAAVARDSGRVAEPLRPQYRVGAAITEADDGGAAIECGQPLQSDKRIGDVGFTGYDFFAAGLRTLVREFAVGARQGPRDGPPEQIGRCGDKSV